MDSTGLRAISEHLYDDNDTVRLIVTAASPQVAHLLTITTMASVLGLDT